MKEEYRKPELEVILFENVDIVTASGEGDDDIDD